MDAKIHLDCYTLTYTPLCNTKTIYEVKDNVVVMVRLSPTIPKHSENNE